MAYIDVVDPAGELVHAGMGLKFPRRSASEILTKLEKFGVGLLVKEDGSVVGDDDVVDSPCVYRLIPYNRLGSSHLTAGHSHSEVEEVMRSVEVALKRHTQLIETLIRSGVKIAHNNSSNSPGGSDDGFCDSRGDQRCSSEPRNGSPTPSGADEAGTSKL
ncbi:hypothetical protein KC19_6G086400 [Ceratodon purpureus]|uniref:Uncharacterized protein n=1 Tax=Ceratodon purpureus TaxID=3225 RepID=A0A8T0HFG5_CERPU|nr:hypothetical protein KC19_6G086400 [Ceratodon purpureus]